MYTILKKVIETVSRTIVVAALVFSFSWVLVKLAKQKSKPVAEAVETIKSETKGKTAKQAKRVPLILLAKDAELNGGGKIKLENFKGKEDIGWWDYDTQWISWKLDIPQGGSYQAELFYSRPGKKKITTKLMIGKVVLESRVPGTGSWSKWSQTDLGTLNVATGKNVECSLKVEDLPGKGVINFISIKLTPVEEE